VRAPRGVVRVAVPFLVVGCLLPLLAGLPAWAGEAQPAVTLQAQVIYATSQPGPVDPRLGTLAGNLQKSLPYKSYQLVDAPKGSAALNQTWRTGIPGDRSLEITPTATEGEHHSVMVRYLGPGGQPLLNTTVRLRRGATFLLGKDTPYREGVLIIAISAN
jgi:hypothetical protein